MSNLNAAFENIYRVRQQAADTNTAVAMQGPNLIINAIATGLDAQLKSQQAQAQMQLGMLDAQIKMESVKSQQMMGLLEFDLKRKTMDQDRTIALSEHQVRLRELNLREQAAAAGLETAQREQIEKQAALDFNRVLGKHSLGRTPEDALTTVTESYDFQQLAEANPAVLGVYMSTLQQQKGMLAGHLDQQINSRGQAIGAYGNAIREIGSQLTKARKDAMELGVDPNKDPAVVSASSQLSVLQMQLNQEVEMSRRDISSKSKLLGLPTGEPAGSSATDMLQQILGGQTATPPADPNAGKSVAQLLMETPADSQVVEDQKKLAETEDALKPLMLKVAKVIPDTGTDPEARKDVVKVRQVIEALSAQELTPEQRQKLAEAQKFLDAGNYKEARYRAEAALPGFTGEPPKPVIFQRIGGY